jgi:hypothetical protein
VNRSDFSSPEHAIRMHSDAPKDGSQDNFGGGLSPVNRYILLLATVATRC